MQTVTTHYRSPSVTINRSSPTSTSSPSQSMIAQQNPFSGGLWPEMGGPYLSALPRNFQDPRYHKRASSGASSIASTGPDSPLDQANIYQPRIATSEAQYSPSRYEFEYSPQSKSAHSMPDSIMYTGNHGFSGIDMRRIHSSGHDDRASYGGPQSVSTMSHHDSPATPQTWDDSYNEEKPTNFNYNSPAFQHSMQEVFPDQSMQQLPYMPNHRHSMKDRLQEASQHHLRTGSPTSNPREKSPFKATSQFTRPMQQSQPQQMPQLQKQRTSISPKELMLEDPTIDENQTPLFPERTNYNRRQVSNMANVWTAPPFNQETSVQIPQTYPFVSQQSSQSVPPDSTPDFPAHMLSMESTNEEASEPSSQQSLHRHQSRNEAVSRPADTSSDAGTYSCTYHGCPQRFDTPAKLQRHKREGHRQHEATNVMASQAIRNSQAGPHRCDRINPSTGKSCNSVFSRPYDLTRHEDTIHNARKQKVRCHLCTEEKTFSRNDALTRHMRVVHPDVDWVGKQKRKSHNR